jgi:hypothetical protein
MWTYIYNDVYFKHVLMYMYVASSNVAILKITMDGLMTETEAFRLHTCTRLLRWYFVYYSHNSLCDIETNY